MFRESDKKKRKTKQIHFIGLNIESATLITVNSDIWPPHFSRPFPQNPHSPALLTYFDQITAKHQHTRVGYLYSSTVLRSPRQKLLASILFMHNNGRGRNQSLRAEYIAIPD